MVYGGLLWYAPEVASHGTSGRIDWLDGWRAVAIALVVAAHLGRLHGIEMPFGTLGVYIFFAISGYIVTNRILSEGNNFEIAHFYVRRAARILPPFLLYVVAVTTLFGHSIDTLRALLFSCNITIVPNPCSWLFGHTWSLAFEEQFYLILPFLFAKRRWFLWVALLVALLPFVYPVHFIGRTGYFQIYSLLGLGALYARYEGIIAPHLSSIPAPMLFVLLPLAGAWFHLPPTWIQMVLAPLEAPAIVVAVFALPLRSASLRDILSSRPMRMLGLYSYSFYLWQQLATIKAPWNQGVMPFVALVAALGLSALSYHTFENWTRNAARNALIVRGPPGSC